MSYNDLYICIYTKQSLAFKKKKKKEAKSHLAYRDII